MAAEGQPSPAFFVVLDGVVGVVDCFGTPLERLLRVVGAGRFLGELGVVTRQPELVTSVALTDGSAYNELGRSPALLETSWPGVFAAGDVRSGSVRRLTAAVGEGAIAVRYVREFLTGRKA